MADNSKTWLKLGSTKTNARVLYAADEVRYAILENCFMLVWIDEYPLL